MPFTSHKTDTWTGLTGEADQMVRNIGHKFWAFVSGSQLKSYLYEIHITDDIEVANKWYDENYCGDPTHGNRPSPIFHAFLVMFAIDAEKAKELFFDAQDQWTAYNNCIEDFLGVVNIDAADRPWTGPEKRKFTYEEWVKEMETRYGITC
jgi:hypothetical protein